MNCPVCKGALTPIADAHPRMLECRFCVGHFLRSNDYWEWRNALEDGEDLPLEELRPLEVPPSAPESQLAKLCPECGRIMTRVRLELELPLFLDRCGGCGATWFDPLKWEVLKSRGLHVEIHQVNTLSWQAKLRRSEIARANERMLRGRIGDADYDEMLRVKGWLETHPARDLILSFLSRAKSSLPVGEPEPRDNRLDRVTDSKVSSP